MFDGLTPADIALMFGISFADDVDPTWKYTGKFKVGDQVKYSNPLDAEAEMESFGPERLTATYTIRRIDDRPQVKQLYGQDAMYVADAPGHEAGLFFEDELSFADE